MEGLLPMSTKPSPPVGPHSFPMSATSPPKNEIFLPYSRSVSYTFILLRETLTSDMALTEKDKIAMENFITLNMAITLNA